jgi:hypothetical protein
MRGGLRQLLNGTREEFRIEKRDNELEATEKLKETGRNILAGST